ncbi:hypothetical protein AAVH_25016 [Aphelenchoides avenae]|nr:hypothetical protein AAVH_25016 [Aphelenchus avenae]
MDNERKSPVPAVLNNDFNGSILHALAARLRCDICYNAYNTSVRAPTTLICGHTFCTKCLHEARHSLLSIRCFVCFRNTAAQPRQLDKNWLLTNILEEVPPAPATTETLPIEARSNSPNNSSKAVNDHDNDDEPDVDFCNPSEQMQVFNRLTQLVYDELFDVEQALNQAQTDTQDDFADTIAEVATMQDTVAQSLLRMHETFTEVKQRYFGMFASNATKANYELNRNAVTFSSDRRRHTSAWN